MSDAERKYWLDFDNWYASEVEKIIKNKNK
jgi:hypothetical protein